MIVNYDKIKNQNKLELAKTLTEIWIASMICNKTIFTPKSEQVTQIVDYFYNWLGEDANE